MDEARVVVTLREGKVELRVPPDFGRNRLDMYQPAIQGLLGLPSEAATEPEKTKPLPLQRRVPAVARASERKPTSCTGIIRSDLEAGIFDKAAPPVRSSND